MPEEYIYLPAGGAIPGLPGQHGPGAYLVDREARTIRPDEASQAQPDAPEAPVEEPAPVEAPPVLDDNLSELDASEGEQA